MPARIVIFGATGYTGRLVAERLVAQGERPVLAGRSEERLARAGRAPRRARVAPGRRPAPQLGVRAASSPATCWSRTVGPFAKWGEPAVRAAIAARGDVPRLDRRAGVHPARVRGVRPAPAARAGAALLTAMGYDFVPGALAGALALEEAGEAAVRVDVGYYALGAGPG